MIETIRFPRNPGSVLTGFAKGTMTNIYPPVTSITGLSNPLTSTLNAANFAIINLKDAKQIGDACSLGYCDNHYNPLIFLPEAIAGEDINAFYAVVILDGLIYHADPADLNDVGRIVGISTTSVTAGSFSRYQQVGGMQGTFTPGARYYVGLNGQLVTPRPPMLAWLKSVGIANNLNELILDLRPEIIVHG